MDELDERIALLETLVRNYEPDDIDRRLALMETLPQIALLTSARREVDGSGYARQPLSREVRFPTATGSWGEVAYAAIFVGDRPVASVRFDCARQVHAGDDLQITIDGLNFGEPWTPTP